MLIGYPTYTFHLKDLLAPSHITRRASSCCWGKYVYSFAAGNTILKYGMSENDSRTNGERVYRQASHFRGWPYEFEGSSGADILITISKYERVTNRFITKNDITLTVWDLGNVYKTQAEMIEAELIENHLRETGTKPIGNVKDHTKALRKRIVNDSLFDRNFEMA